MSAELQIADGIPLWLSPSIIPSKDTVIGKALREAAGRRVDATVPDFVRNREALYREEEGGLVEQAFRQRSSAEGSARQLDDHAGPRTSPGGSGDAVSPSRSRDPPIPVSARTP